MFCFLHENVHISAIFTLKFTAKVIKLLNSFIKGRSKFYFIEFFIEFCGISFGHVFADISLKVYKTELMISIWIYSFDGLDNTWEIITYNH